MVNRRGEVWWGPAPHKSSPSYRPWLVVSDGSAPFADEEAIVLVLTTRAHNAGIAAPTIPGCAAILDVTLTFRRGT